MADGRFLDERWMHISTVRNTHPKIARVARMLKQSRVTIQGVTESMYAWAANMGNREGILHRETLIDMIPIWWPECPDPDTLITALINAGVNGDTGLLETIDGDSEHLLIHDWDQWAGKHLAEKDQDAARKREERAAKEKRINGTSAGRPPDIPVTSGRRLNKKDEKDERGLQARAREAAEFANGEPDGPGQIQPPPADAGREEAEKRIQTPTTTKPSPTPSHGMAPPAEHKSRYDRRDESPIILHPSEAAAGRPVEECLFEPVWFKAFWDVSPKKSKRRQALQIWNDIDPDYELGRRIIYGTWRLDDEGMFSDDDPAPDPQYILDDERWRDGLDKWNQPQIYEGPVEGEAWERWLLEQLIRPCLANPNPEMRRSCWEQMCRDWGISAYGVEALKPSTLAGQRGWRHLTMRTCDQWFEPHQTADYEQARLIAMLDDARRVGDAEAEARLLAEINTPTAKIVEMEAASATKRNSRPVAARSTSNP